MNKIYGSSDRPEGDMHESLNEIGNNQRMEEKFIEALSNEIVKILKIGYKDSNTVSTLLQNILSDKLYKNYKNEGLLDQYKMYILDRSMERFYDDLDIPKDIKINHGYADHAKFADVIKYINANFERKVVDIDQGDGSDEPKDFLVKDADDIVERQI
jgi:hypothetical protein